MAEIRSRGSFHALPRACTLLLGGALLWCASCAPAKPATTAQLRMRAAFDLGCSPHLLQVYPLDVRSRAVVGCGHRLAYVEVCEPYHGRTGCGWVLDSPSWGQAPRAQSAATRCPATALPPRAGWTGAADSLPEPPAGGADSVGPDAPATPAAGEIRDLGY